MRNKVSTILFLILGFSFFGADLPKNNGTYVSDYADLVSEGTEQYLNDTLFKYEKKTSTQIVILTVNSLNDRDVETYANEVFVSWGIGQEKIDNGVLILVSKVDRKIRIETGYGSEAYITDGEAGEIIRNLMVPYFKEGDFNSGIKNAAQEVMLQLADLEYEGMTKKTKDFKVTPFGWGFFMIFFGIFLIPVFKWLSFWYRRLKPRKSTKSGEWMKRLSNADEKPFLSPEQQMEESLGTVNYDVWVTSKKDDVEVLAYRSKNYEQYKCTNCGFFTNVIVDTLTLSEASYSRAGQKKQVYQCKSCQHSSSKMVLIPRLERVVTPYVGGGGFGGGGFGGSGGGGFSGGGGSSGGGGASGDW